MPIMRIRVDPKKPSVWWVSQLQNDSPFFTWPAPNSLILLGWLETHIQTLAGQSFRNAVPRIGLQENLQKPPTLHLVVSWNRATPSSHPFIDGIFHYRSTIVGYPHDYGKPHLGWKKHPAAAASAPGWCDHRDLCALLLWKWLVRDPSCRLSSVGSGLNWYTYSYTKNVYVYACAYV